jgi:hypothetical protein
MSTLHRAAAAKRRVGEQDLRPPASPPPVSHVVHLEAVSLGERPLALVA